MESVKDTLLKIERIAPFAIVSYFLISGIFAGDFKQFFVFLGLLLSAAITIVISKLMENYIYPGQNANDIIANIASYNIFYLGSTPMSYVPLSINIYVFLLCYYLYILFSYDKTIGEDTKNRKSENKKQREILGRGNAPLLTILCLFIVIEVIYLWNTFKNPIAISLPILIGVISGTIWPMIIGRPNWAMPLKELSSKCNLTDINYSCKLNTSGKLITVP